MHLSPFFRKQALVFTMLLFAWAGMAMAQNTIALEEIWKYRVFAPRTIRLGKSMNDGEHFTRLEGRNRIGMYSYATGEFVSILADVQQLYPDGAKSAPPIDDCFFSDDEQKILLAFNTRTLFRHSSEAGFFVFDRVANTFYPLSSQGIQRLPQFSPDGRGEAFRKSIYMQLGKLEAQDQIAVARYLTQLVYVNQSNRSIFGWSYGSYLAALCLALGADVFHTAIALAPVTSRRFCDTIYNIQNGICERHRKNPSG